MPRLPRLILPSGNYHCYGRGVDRALIFRDDVDANAWVDRLADCLEGTSIVIPARSELPNHYHLGVETGDEPELSFLMQRFLGGYARRFNRRHGRTGPLFESRFHSKLVEPGHHMQVVIRYVLDNPRRHGAVSGFRGLVNTARSSFGAILGKRDCRVTDVDAALARFGSRRELLAFMFAGRHERGELDELFPTAERFLAEESDLRIIGSTDFVQRMKKRIAELNPQRPIVFEGNLSTLLREVIRTTGIDLMDLTAGSRKRDVSHARAIAAYLGSVCLKVPHVELARLLGVSASAITNLVPRGRMAVADSKNSFGILQLRAS